MPYVLDAALEQEYPAIIAQMPDEFTSHEFILALARQNQRAYIEFLYAHRTDAYPFQSAHAALSRGLHNFKNLVEHLREVNSTDIWTNSNTCASWRKK